MQLNGKAIVILQCGLAPEQMNKVGPFKSTKELWDKLMELNKVQILKNHQEGHFGKPNAKLRNEGQ